MNQSALTCPIPSNLAERSSWLALEELLSLPVTDSDKHHFSFIFHKNRLVAAGRNKTRKTHPLAAVNKYHFETIHSELDAYLKIPYGMLSKKLVMINIRLSGKSRKRGIPILRMAKPCDCCGKWLKTVGFKKIIFSTEKEFMLYE